MPESIDVEIEVEISFPSASTLISRTQSWIAIHGAFDANVECDCADDIDGCSLAGRPSRLLASLEKSEKTLLASLSSRFSFRSRVLYPHIIPIQYYRSAIKDPEALDLAELPLASKLITNISDIDLDLQMMISAI